MCLYAKAKVLKSVKERLAKDGFILGYKVVEIRQGKVSSECRQAHTWKAGWNVSHVHKNGVNDAVENTDSLVDGGIHVFLNRRTATNYAKRNSYRWTYAVKNLAVLPVMCFGNDLIAAGTNNCVSNGAVFSKVFVKNGDFVKASKTKLPPKNVR